MEEKNNNFLGTLNPFAGKITDGISVFTAVKNRRPMLEQTIATWLSNDSIDEIIIVDWSSDDDLISLIKSFQSDKIILALVPAQPQWILSHAYNLAARLTSHSKLLKIDADVKILDGFFELHPLTPGNFFTGNWQKARNANERHLHGTCYLYRDDFFKVNGYNEYIKTYGWDDIDLYERLVSVSIVQNDISHDTLYHIEHASRTSFQNHMQFLKTSDDYEKALLNALINRFLTEITRNWIKENHMLSFAIRPESQNLFYCVQEHEDRNIASREIIHQCEWKAMVQRLNELGIKLPGEFLKEITHHELLTLMNLNYEREEAPALHTLFELIRRMNAKYYKALEQMYSLNREKNIWIEDKNGMLAIIDSQEKELENAHHDLELRESTIRSLNSKIDNLYNSYSWKLGHTIMSGASMIYRVFPAAPERGKKESKQELPIQPDRKLNLGEELAADYGQHRSGWAFAVASLESLHKPDGVVLDAFIERTFVWHPKGVKPHLEPWVGFIHIPPIVPEWFGGRASNKSVFSTVAWKESLPYCKGLFTLSEYHKKNLETQLNIPINNLLHPTENTLHRWDWKKFLNNREKKVIQIGYWLRKLLAIYALEAPREYQKCFIRKEIVNLDHIFEMEKKNSEYKHLLNEKTLSSVKTINFLSNEDYDELLTGNIVFLDLYDSSANNTIIECIVRNTPILVNPLEPVIEYLGNDYPFYFHNLQEASDKLGDKDLIKKTHIHLKNHPVKKKLTGSYFLSSVVNSPIYKSL